MTFIAKMGSVFDTQQGFISTRQAKDAGYSNALLTHLVKQGELNRVARGIYRLANHPECREELAFIATLWSSGECILGHRSALAAAGVLPWEREWVEVCLAPDAGFRPRKTPTGIMLHHEAVPVDQQTEVGFLRACSVPWAIAQCVRDNLGASFVRELLPRCFEIPDWCDEAFLEVTGRLLSDAQVEMLADLVDGARRLRLLPSGAHTAVPVVPRRRPDRAGATPTVRTNLAPESGPIVGRVEDLQRLENLFAEGNRLVTVLGSAGLGKTRLALRFGGLMLSAREHHSVWYVSLQEARSDADICSAVAHALHIPMQGDAPAEDQLAFAIDDMGPALLVLDNLEQVVDAAAPLLRKWFDEAPDCLFLVTSRHRLDLRTEALLQLEPLRYGEAWDGDLPSEAGQLFVQQARSVHPSYHPDADEAARIEAIVGRLDGIPLAIELAAARMEVLTSHEVLRRLQDRFELLATTSRDLPERHTTLRHAIDWSWELLSDDEREALSLCAVFKGGFTLEAAEHVVRMDRSISVLDLIQALVGKSMVHRAHATKGTAPTRFVLYESVREYAQERLDEAGYGTQAEERHTDFYLRQAWWSEAGQRLMGDTRVVTHVGSERRNLRDVYERALAARQADDAARAAILLSAVYSALGPLEQGIERIEAVLELRDQLGPLLEARLLVALGGMKRLTRGIRLERLQRALELARQAEDRHLEGLALAMLARVLNLLSRRSEAWDQTDLALATNPKDDVRALVHDVRGLILAARGKAREAEEEYQDAIHLYRKVENLAGEGECLTNIAILHSWNSRPDEARSALAGALEISHKTGQTYLRARARSYLGLACLRLGALRQGLSHLAEARHLHRALGNRFGEAFVLQLTGRLEILLGHFDQAGRHQDAALRVFAELRLPRSQIVCLIDQAHCDTVQGRVEEARYKLNKAWDLTDQVEDATVRGGILIYRALLATHDRQADTPRDIWAEAIAILTRNELEDNEFLDALPVMRAALDASIAVGLDGSGDQPGAELMRERAFGRVENLLRPGEPSLDHPWGSPSHVQRTFSSRAAFQLLWAALPDNWRARVEIVRANPGNESLVVDQEGNWFDTPAAPRADLSQRPTLRRIVAFLAERRRNHPGEGVTHDDLVAAGWPDESLVGESGINRVYAAITTLRNAGLRDILVAAEDGYLLTPTLPMITVETRIDRAAA